MGTAANQDKLWTGNYIILLGGGFFTFLPFFTLLTTLPIFVVAKLQLSDQAAGAVNTVFLLSAVFFRPISGRLVDTLGLKRITSSSMFFYLATTALYFAADQYYALLAIRFVNGVFFSIASTAILAMGPYSVPVSRQGEGIGYIATVANLATVFGPFIGLSLARVGRFDLLFMLCTASVLLAAVISTRVHMPENQVVARPPLSIIALFERKAIPVSSVAFFVGIAYSGVVSFYPLYARQLNLLTAGSYFFVVFALCSLAGRISVGRIYDKRGMNVIAYPCLMLFAIGALVLSFSSSSVHMLAAGALIGIGYGSLMPTFQTVAIQSSPKERTGAATATYFALLDGGISFGSFVLGSVVGLMGYSRMYSSLSVLIICCMVGYHLLFGRKAHTAHIPG